jgi:quinol monooxygenase YgiN
MISFTVRMQFREEDRLRVEEVLRELALASRQEPGCVTYVPHRVEGNPDTVVVYEQYADQAALEAHRATEHFRKYAVAGLYQMMRERSVENFTTLI